MNKINLLKEIDIKKSTEDTQQVKITVPEYYTKNFCPVEDFCEIFDIE
jgi:hypothetical protein